MHACRMDAMLLQETFNLGRRGARLDISPQDQRVRARKTPPPTTIAAILSYIKRGILTAFSTESVCKLPSMPVPALADPNGQPRLHHDGTKSPASIHVPYKVAVRSLMYFSALTRPDTVPKYSESLRADQHWTT